MVVLTRFQVYKYQGFKLIIRSVSLNFSGQTDFCCADYEEIDAECVRMYKIYSKTVLKQIPCFLVS